MMGPRHIDFAERTAIEIMAQQLEDLSQKNDALAAEVAQWKSRAETAEAKLRSIEEDDRHLTTLK